MIYELRTYTVKAGTIGDMVKAASTVSREVRGDDYGKLEGYWSTEIGPLNQVMHLWSYSRPQRARPAPRRAFQERALEQRLHPADPSPAGPSGRPPVERDPAPGRAGHGRQHL